MINKTVQHTKRLLTLAVVVVLIGTADCRATSVTVAWNPTTTATDGSPIENISFYRLFYGVASGVYDTYVDITSGTSATVSGIEYNKDYFFAIKTFTEISASTYSTELRWSSPLMADVDTDQISDDWELQYSGALSSLQESTDYDQDGTSDLGEFIAGTNPLDPSDYPVVSISSTATETTVSFNTRHPVGKGYENRTRRYTLMESDDLSQGSWSVVPSLENIIAEGQSEQHAVDMVGPSKFYRTEIFLE